MMLATRAGAQCSMPGRYVDALFPTVDTNTVIYSDTFHLPMTIYQPHGDVYGSRPLIILGHGGSFITGNGDRTNDPTIIKLCNNFAQRGYVVVSIDYRTTDIFTLLNPDSSYAIDGIVSLNGG